MGMYAQKISSTIVAMVAIALITTSSATATVTDSLDSTSFDWQYEFDVLPSAQDLDSNGVADFGLNGDAGTLNGDGTWSMDTSAGSTVNSFFMASAADQIWAQSGISWETGYTIEARIRVNSTNQDATLGSLYMTSTAQSESGATNWLNLSASKESWGASGSPAMVSDNSDDFHVFRVAQEPGLDSFSVWRDETLLAENIPAGYSNASLNRLILGDAGGTLGGSADVDYFRFTAGAYAPTNVVAQEPPSTQKASSDFTYKYEMDVDPIDPSQIDLDSNLAADWVVAGTGNVSLTGNGTLSIDSNGETFAYLDSGIADPSALWPNVDFNTVDGFTVEISAKLDPSSGAFGVVAAPSDSTEMFILNILPDGQQRDFDAIGDEETVYDNTDAFHNFRITRTPNGDGGRYYVWRDGELLSPEGLFATRSYERNALYFGDLSGATDALAEVDYIRFMEGVFAPVEVTPDIAGDANKDGKVDGSDVTILAGNWQKGVNDGLTASWEEGDFNGDGKVDGSDVTILAGNWQYGVETSAASVPEPSTILLILSVLAGVVGVRRRK